MQTSFSAQCPRTDVTTTFLGKGTWKIGTKNRNSKLFACPKPPVKCCGPCQAAKTVTMKMLSKENTLFANSIITWDAIKGKIQG